MCTSAIQSVWLICILPFRIIFIDSTHTSWLEYDECHKNQKKIKDREIKSIFVSLFLTPQKQTSNELFIKFKRACLMAGSEKKG